jgi:hypothetical protein
MKPTLISIDIGLLAGRLLNQVLDNLAMQAALNPRMMDKTIEIQRDWFQKEFSSKLIELLKE